MILFNVQLLWSNSDILYPTIRLDNQNERLGSEDDKEELNEWRQTKKGDVINKAHVHF